MTEWTSLSVTEEQKRQIEAAKEQAGHDGSMGRFVVGLIDSNESADVDDLQAVTATPEDLTKLRSDLLERLDELTTAQSNGDPVQLEATEYTKIAEEVVGRLR